MSKRIKVTVLKGEDLVVRDGRSSDPYVVLTLGNNQARTKVVKQNLNPVWNEEFVFPITDANLRLLKIKVWDQDKFLYIDHLDRDDPMGEAEVDLRPLLNGVFDAKKEKIVLPTSKENCFFRDSYITQCAGGKRVQEVCLKLRKVESGVVYLQIEAPGDYYCSAPKREEMYSLPPKKEEMYSSAPKREEMSKRVKVEVFKGAGLAYQDRRSSDPYVVLRLGNNEARTKVVEQNSNPVWNEEFVFTITDTNHCFLTIKVCGKDQLPNDDPMGEAKVDLRPLVNGDDDATKEKIMLPRSKENCFFEDSYITQYANGKRVQEVCLKLRKVDSGVVDATKKTIELPAENIVLPPLKVDWLNRRWNLESGFGKEKIVLSTSIQNFLKGRYITQCGNSSLRVPKTAMSSLE